jgi:hypothetical protein
MDPFFLLHRVKKSKWAFGKLLSGSYKKYLFHI